MKVVSLTDGGLLSGNKFPCSPLRWSIAPIWGLYFEGTGPYRIVEDAQIQSWTQLKTKEQPFAGVMCPFCYIPFVAFRFHQFKVY